MRAEEAVRFKAPSTAHCAYAHHSTHRRASAASQDHVSKKGGHRLMCRGLSKRAATRQVNMERMFT